MVKIVASHKAQNQHRRYDGENETFLFVGEQAVEKQKTEGGQEEEQTFESVEKSEQQQHTQRRSQKSQQHAEIFEERPRKIIARVEEVIIHILAQFHERLAPHKKVADLGETHGHNHRQRPKHGIAPTFVDKHRQPETADKEYHLKTHRKGASHQQSRNDDITDGRFLLFSHVKPRGAEQERDTENLHQVAHRQPRQAPQYGGGPANKVGRFAVAAGAEGKLVGKKYGEQREKCVQYPDYVHLGIEGGYTHLVESGEGEEMQRGVEKRVSRRLWRGTIVGGQPVVVVVTFHPRVRRFDDQKMVVVHAVTFGEKGRNKPQHQGHQDNIFQRMAYIVGFKIFDTHFQSRLLFL